MTNGYRRGSLMIFRRRKRKMEDNHIEVIGVDHGKLSENIEKQKIM